MISPTYDPTTAQWISHSLIHSSSHKTTPSQQLEAFAVAMQPACDSIAKVTCLQPDAWMEQSWYSMSKPMELRVSWRDIHDKYNRWVGRAMVDISSPRAKIGNAISGICGMGVYCGAWSLKRLYTLPSCIHGTSELRSFRGRGQALIVR